jgi:prevent-host-death family protein
MVKSKPTIVNVHEAKTHFSRLLDRAHRGEEIILAKSGKPYAKLVPLDRPAKRVPGGLEGLKLSEKFFEPLPQEELDAWEGRLTTPEGLSIEEDDEA